MAPNFSIPLPFWGVGPRHWLFRSLYSDEDFFFYAADGQMLAAAAGRSIPGRKILGLIPTASGAEVLLSKWDTELEDFQPVLSFSQRNGKSDLSGANVRHPLARPDSSFASELNWNGLTGIYYNSDGNKIGSVTLPNPLKREFRIYGPHGLELCTATVTTEAPIEVAPPATVLHFHGNQQELDIRLLAATMQVITLLN
ncbi:MAG: hypothetical protein H8E15_00230 [Planctomycetes bacterium]|nr:hypothetical protein [Planctomycetota bacterium]